MKSKVLIQKQRKKERNQAKEKEREKERIKKSRLIFNSFDYAKCRHSMNNRETETADAIQFRCSEARPASAILQFRIPSTTRTQVQCIVTKLEWHQKHLNRITGNNPNITPILSLKSRLTFSQRISKNLKESQRIPKNPKESATSGPAILKEEEQLPSPRSSPLGIAQRIAKNPRELEGIGATDGEYEGGRADASVLTAACLAFSLSWRAVRCKPTIKRHTAIDFWNDPSNVRLFFPPLPFCFFVASGWNGTSASPKRHSSNANKNSCFLSSSTSSLATSSLATSFLATSCSDFRSFSPYSPSLYLFSTLFPPVISSSFSWSIVGQLSCMVHSYFDPTLQQ